jgi:hypothetical protein
VNLEDKAGVEENLCRASLDKQICGNAAAALAGVETGIGDVLLGYSLGR